ncbi:MAG: ABC transporter permease [Anaerolineae bacterium]
MNLPKVLLIARREFSYNVRRKAFLFTMFGLPVFIVAMLWLGAELGRTAATDISAFKRVGVVDLASLITDSNGRSRIDLPEPFEIMAESTASALLEAKEIEGYYILREDFLTTRKPEAVYRRELVIGEALTDALFDKVIKPSVAARVGDPALVARIENPLEELSVYRLGSTQKLDEGAQFAAIFAPIMVGILVFSMTMAVAQYLMMGLVEEKENRMMELFMTSARPIEMLWGKLIGLGTLGIVQIGVWLIMAGIAAALSGTDLMALLASVQITPNFILIILLFTVMGYGVNASLMAAVGAAVNSEQESRQLASVVSLASVLPIMLLFVFFIDPNGAFATFMSIFPLTSPTGMIVRAALIDVPSEQVILSIVLLLVTMWGVMWLSARIFRLGMLNYGKRLTLGQIWRALREGRQQIVSARTGGEVAENHA